MQIVPESAFPYYLRGIGDNSFRRVQLDQGHGRKDKDPTAEVP